MFVIICGKKVPIILKSGRAMKNTLGEFCTETEEISIKQSTPKELRRRTLSHECFHAFLHFTGYAYLLDDISANCEEALTRAFDSGMGNMLRYPKDVEEWINA